MATKKTSTKAPVKKTAAKKAAAPAVKPAPAAKPAPAPKAAPAPQKPAKKAVKKAAVKKAPSAQLTTVVAHIDIGWGNSLYIRGEGAGLSWESGVLMDWVDGAWSWSTTAAKDGLAFKFLINDEIWAAGEDLSVEAGGTSVSSPSF